MRRNRQSQAHPVAEFSRQPPPWVRWIAQDADGAWWGYEAEPHQGAAGWYENEIGRLQRLGRGAPNPGWRNALFPYP